jgi:carboxy-terminal domain RNA polymerase II polypeptide A small phosphatase
VLIIDNSPASYIFQPENALPISSWIDNPNDQELLDLVAPLTELTKAYDVTDFLRSL